MNSDQLFLFLGMRDITTIFWDFWAAVANLFLSPDALSIYVVTILFALIRWASKQTT